MRIKARSLDISSILLIATLLLACSQQPSTSTLGETARSVTPAALESSATPLTSASLSPTPLPVPTRIKTATVIATSPTPPSFYTTDSVAPSAVAKQTVTSISFPTLTPHSTTGIHLSLQACGETEHFVLYCVEADEIVSVVIASNLEYEYRQITSHLNRPLSEKINVEVYPNLQSFHAAVNHQQGLEWFVGKAESGKIQMVTPLNPGPKHTFDTIMSTAVHEFIHLVVDEINENEIPAWLDEGIATFEAGQRQPQFVAARIEHNLPTISDLNFSSGTDTNTIYAFSYTIVEFIVQEFGYDFVVELIVREGDFEEALNISEKEFEQMWQEFIVAEYASFQDN